mgnify:FL=1
MTLKDAEQRLRALRSDRDEVLGRAILPGLLPWEAQSRLRNINREIAALETAISEGKS